MQNRAKLLTAVGSAAVVLLAFYVTTVGPWLAGPPGGAGSPGSGPAAGTTTAALPPTAGTSSGNDGTTTSGGTGGGTAGGPGGQGPMGPPPKWGLRMADHQDHASSEALEHRLQSMGRHVGLTQVLLSQLNVPKPMQP